MIEIFLEKWHSTPIIKSCKYMTGYEQTNDGGEGKAQICPKSLKNFIT
jgi:hypothetical protein